MWFGATVAALAGLAIGLCVAVDPYRMYGTPVLPGWTELKPQIYDQIDLAATYQLERVRPITLLLGNSRVEVGINPESPHWPAAAQPVFNGALPGRDLRTAVDMLRQAIAVHVPKTVIVGLDILDFLQKPDPLPPPQAPIGPEERRLLVDRNGKPNPARRLQVWRDRGATTLTVDAVGDSLATLLDQNPRTTATLTPLGFDPLNQYRVFAARQGYYELFAQKNAIYRKQYAHRPTPDFTQPERYADFRALQQIFAQAKAHGIELILFIHPYHADYFDMLQRAGLWSSFEAWKRALVAMVAAANASDAREPIRLFDFSGYNRYTTEPVPPVGDRRTAMRWYWEAGHYKSALGEEMLPRMLGQGGAFGVALTSDNIEPVLAQIRADGARYHAARGIKSDSAAALPAR